MSTRLNPRLGLVLLVVLGLSAFLSLQPSPDDDLGVPARGGATSPGPGGQSAARGAARQDEPAAAGPRGAAGGPGAAVSARAASQPTPAQARDLALWAEAWAWRSARSWPATAADARWAWASQQPPPPPPPPPPPQEPAPPMAPRFPYAWVGRFVDEAPRAVIAGPTGTWVLRQGEVLEGQWRLGPIAERQLTVTYLPLGQDQTVALK